MVAHSPDETRRAGRCRSCRACPRTCSQDWATCRTRVHLRSLCHTARRRPTRRHPARPHPISEPCAERQGRPSAPAPVYRCGQLQHRQPRARCPTPAEDDSSQLDQSISVGEAVRQDLSGQGDDLSCDGFPACVAATRSTRPPRQPAARSAYAVAMNPRSVTKSMWRAGAAATQPKQSVPSRICANGPRQRPLRGSQ